MTIAKISLHYILQWVIFLKTIFFFLMMLSKIASVSSFKERKFFEKKKKKKKKWVSILLNIASNTTDFY